MILEPTKRTPCFHPAQSFPPRRPTRTAWSTTRTCGPSRNPKWGGRNETGAAEAPDGRLAHARCFQRSAQRAAACWWIRCAGGWMYSDCLLLKTTSFVVCRWSFVFNRHCLKCVCHVCLWATWRNTVFFFFFFLLKMPWQTCPPATCFIHIHHFKMDDLLHSEVKSSQPSGGRLLFLLCYIWEDLNKKNLHIPEFFSFPEDDFLFVLLILFLVHLV